MCILMLNRNLILHPSLNFMLLHVLISLLTRLGLKIFKTWLLHLVWFPRDYRAVVHEENWANCPFKRKLYLWTTGQGNDIFIKLEYITHLLVKIKSMLDCHLFIIRMETKWTKWYATTSHVIAYRSLELLFGMHTFHFNCFFMILIAYLRKYTAYLRCCETVVCFIIHPIALDHMETHTMNSD